MSVSDVPRGAGGPDRRGDGFPDWLENPNFLRQSAADGPPPEPRRYSLLDEPLMFTEGGLLPPIKNIPPSDQPLLERPEPSDQADQQGRPEAAPPDTPSTFRSVVQKLGQTVGKTVKDAVAARQETIKEGLRKTFPPEAASPTTEREQERPWTAPQTDTPGTGIQRHRVEWPQPVADGQVDTPRDAPRQPQTVEARYVERERQPTLKERIAEAERLTIASQDRETVDASLELAVHTIAEDLQQREGDQYIVAMDATTSPDSRITTNAPEELYTVEQSAFLDPRGALSEISGEDFDGAVADVVAARHGEADSQKYQEIMRLARFVGMKVAAVPAKSEGGDDTQQEPPVTGALAVPLSVLRDVAALAGGAHFDESYVPGKGMPAFPDHPEALNLRHHKAFRAAGNADMHDKEAARRVYAYLSELEPPGKTPDYSHFRTGQGSGGESDSNVKLVDIKMTGPRVKVAAQGELAVRLLPDILEKYTGHGQPPALVFRNADKAPKGQLETVRDLCTEKRTRLVQTMHTVPEHALPLMKGDDKIVSYMEGDDAAHMSQGAGLVDRVEVSSYSEGMNGTVGTNTSEGSGWGVESGGKSKKDGNENRGRGTADSVTGSKGQVVNILRDAPILRQDELKRIPENRVVYVRARDGSRQPATVHALDTGRHIMKWPPIPKSMEEAGDTIKEAAARTKGQLGEASGATSVTSEAKPAIGASAQGKSPHDELMENMRSGSDRVSGNLQALRMDFFRQSGNRLSADWHPRRFRAFVVERYWEELQSGFTTDSPEVWSANHGVPDITNDLDKL